MTINAFEWDSLLIPDELSLEEEENHSTLVSNYLSRLTEDVATDRSSVEKTTKIKVDDSLIDTEEVQFEKITNDELFNYFQCDKEEVDADILFPKTDKINLLFWFLHNLGQNEIKNTKFKISNPKQVSIAFYEIIEAAAFFGFLTRFVEDETFYFVPTAQYVEFIDSPLEKQYHQFLASMGSNETISEILQIQLNNSIYDNISKQMVHNILVEDPNISNENLSNDEVKQIVNDMRYWYLGIKKIILKN